MGRETLALIVAGACAVAIVGWIVWAERPVTAEPTVTPAANTDSAAGVSGLTVDEDRVAELEAAAQDAPDDPAPRRALGELYFGAGRFDDAIPWYEDALSKRPLTVDDVPSGVNMAVSYYYTGEMEQAAALLDRLLDVAPTDSRALLTLGVVRAFGLQDLTGATETWERLIEVAPGTPEAGAAREALDELKASHDLSAGVEEAP